MKEISTHAARATALALGCLLLSAAIAGAQPATIPRMASAPQSPSRTFKLVRDFLLQAGGADMKIASEDTGAHKIVATRQDIDTQTWGEWAYCKLGPSHLLDTLENGAVTVTVDIEPAANNTSFVKVTADFRGTYTLGSSETATTCVSNGVLEDDILRAAGASPQGS